MKNIFAVRGEKKMITWVPKDKYEEFVGIMNSYTISSAEKLQSTWIGLAVVH